MLLNILETRRSIRQFSDEKIIDAKKEKLKEMILRAPSGKGINPWEFIFVEKNEMLDKLSLSKAHGASLLKNAKLAIVILADSSKTDVWIEDASIASIIAHLGAHSLSLGSCWVQIRKRNYNDTKSSEEYIKELFKIDDVNIRVLSIVGIGNSLMNKEGHKKSSLDYNKIHYEKF